MTSLALLPGLTYSQDSDGRVEIRHADSLVGSSINGAMVRELLGNVELFHNGMTVRCRRAVQYMAGDRFLLSGAVVITQGTLTLRTESGTYDGPTRVASSQTRIVLTDPFYTITADGGSYAMEEQKALFNGNVDFAGDSLAVSAERVVYNRISQDVRATGRVVAVGDSLALTGDTVDYNRISRFTRSFGNAFAALEPWQAVACGDTIEIDPEARLSTVRGGMPRMVRSSAGDSVRVADTSVVRAALIRLSDTPADGKVMLAEGQALFTSTSDLTARGQRLRYGSGNGRIDLTDTTAVLWYGTTELSADSIAAYLRQSSLDSIHAVGRAFSTTVEDTSKADRRSQLQGSSIEVLFALDTVRQVTALDSAYSLYFVYTEGVPDGVSKSASDTIEIRMEGGTPAEIAWIGETDGEQIPEPMVYGKLEELKLPRWRVFARPEKLVHFTLPEYAQRQLPRLRDLLMRQRSKQGR